LIHVYGSKKNIDENEKVFISDDSDQLSNSSNASSNSDTDSVSPDDMDDNQDDYAYRDVNIMHAGNTDDFLTGKELSIEFLENDIDTFQSVDNLDGTNVSAIFGSLIFLQNNVVNKLIAILNEIMYFHIL